MAPFALAVSCWFAVSDAQSPSTAGKSDLELVERVLETRLQYQKALEKLRIHYDQTGDKERLRWVEDELIQYQRTPKYCYRLELEGPLKGTHNGTADIPEATKLYQRALQYKDKGYGTDYLDNQRRAEILFQELIAKYPNSDKTADSAYMLGEIYESRIYKQYERAAEYFKRCAQWNPRTNLDARLRAAKLYDKNVGNKTKAIEMYKEVVSREGDPRRIQEAQRRLKELGAGN
jgi:TolA-binding protein